MNKKMLTLILVLVISMSSTSLGFAADKTTDEMAEILDTINVFKGDDTGYNLDGRLKRSEAATLVVRLLGKTEEVKNKEDKYSKTSFTDVKVEDWFSPYVGYCEENSIIAGFPDGTFKPNEYITEKAFTQLILGVLGYTSKSDFNWENVLQFSLDVGVNEDVTYAFRTNDRSIYTRGEAVGLIYRALDKKIKSSTTKVADLIIKSGLTSYDALVAVGVYKKDVLLSEIETVIPMSKKIVKVTFNEEVTFDKEDVFIEYLGKSIEIEDINNFPTSLEIVLKENMIENAVYKLNISKVNDIENNEVANISEDFTAFEEPQIVSSFFKISKIETISNEKLRVYFTHPINENAQQVLLYEIYKNGSFYFEGSFKNLSISLDPVIESAIIMKANGYTFDKESKYTLKIKGDLKSGYEAHLNKGTGDSMIFDGTDVNQFVELPEIVESSFLDKDLVKVVFSNMVDEESAKKLSNYRLTNNKNSLELAPSKIYFDRDKENQTSEIVIRFNSTSSLALYNLKIKDIYAVDKINKIKDSTIDIGQGISSSKSPELVHAVPLNRSTIELIFDMKLNDLSENCSVQLTNGLYAKVKKVDDNNPYRMLLYLSRVQYMNDDKDYKVTISGGLVDEFDRRQRYSINSTFPGYSLVEEDTGIESASFISNNLVMVRFNKDIRKQDLNSADKFDFIYKEGSLSRTLFATSAKYIDSKTIIVGFDYLLGDGNLSIVAKDFYNITGDKKYNQSESVIENYVEIK